MNKEVTLLAVLYMLFQVGCGTEVGNGFDPETPTKSREESPTESQKAAPDASESFAEDDSQETKGKFTTIKWVGSDAFESKNKKVLDSLDSSGLNLEAIVVLSPCNPIISDYNPSIWINSSNKQSQIKIKENLLSRIELGIQTNLPDKTSKMDCKSINLSQETLSNLEVNEMEIIRAVTFSLLENDYTLLLHNKATPILEVLDSNHQTLEKWEWTPETL